MYSILFLLLVLVIIISVEVYRVSEGFANMIEPSVNTMVTPVATTVSDAPILSTLPATSELDAIAHDKQERAKLIRDIQEAVRTELLADKKITTANAQPLIKNSSDSSSCSVSTQSSAEQQGKEAITARAVDMSQYVRKDSIPCWNCTLDY
jgi:hypothetical protein